VTRPTGRPGVGARESVVEQLRPLCDALRAEAQARARTILAEADREARSTLADAQRRADELRGAARAQGAADARRRGDRVVAEARRRTRSQVLRARRELYERVGSIARTRLAAVEGTAAARELNERLAAEARERLGDECVVHESPVGVGIVASAGRRRLDLSLDALVEREMNRGGTRIEEVWS
jgi:vacuolar-type H+-ATPase subunit E/Vma4